MLEAAGFMVNSRDPTPNSRQYERGFYEGILANREQLAAEMGESVTEEMYEEANEVLPIVEKIRRVLIVARREA